MNEKIRSFEDLNVWKESVRLAVAIYNSLINCKDYSLKDQMQESAVSLKEQKTYLQCHTISLKQEVRSFLNRCPTIPLKEQKIYGNVIQSY